MSTFKQKTVLITGGASGIGRIMSRLALERGAEVVILDVNAAGIEQTVGEFSAIGKIAGYAVDVSDYEQVEQTLGRVRSEVGAIDILINNAGVVTGNFFHLHTRKDIDRNMCINAMAPMYITNLLLGEMLERDSGHICNIASMAGMISNPRMSVYAASKWAVVGWSDSLRLEMKQLRKQVKITTILPYYIDTGMFAGVKSLVPILKPERTARQIIRAIERNRIFFGMPWTYNFVRSMEGLLPVRLFDLIVGKWMGIYGAMEHFTGRK
ncbi:MAG: SDR family oxidoreductase [Tannerella sp.]|jgi:short-subunit dehydrogenase|nr:SDR family oxidoreductase [Tannerella sp.]